MARKFVTCPRERGEAARGIIGGRMRRAAAALVAAAIVPAAACRAPARGDATPHGLLDPGFGAAGLVSDDIAHGQDAAKAVVADGAGRILLAGRAQDITQSFDGNLAVLRLDATGTL